MPSIRPVASGSTFTAGALPATYVGVVPCADCPGIRWTLNLYPDGVFRQRLEYLERSENGRPARFDDGGRWALAANGEQLVLRGDGGSTDLFALRGDDTLRKLDAEGREIATTLDYDLKRAPVFAPF
ncbi:MAG: copper resistance protein NlpE [Candidatus Krumholzibacteriia bacterium]